jgi:hypothetical protein
MSHDASVGVRMNKPFPCDNLLEYAFEFLFNEKVPEYLSTVFGCPNDMVLADVSTVTKPV